MSSKKLTALIAQIPDDFVPLFGLTVCFGIWLVLNLPAETRVLERLFTICSAISSASTPCSRSSYRVLAWIAVAASGVFPFGSVFHYLADISHF